MKTPLKITLFFVLPLSLSANSKNFDIEDWQDEVKQSSQLSQEDYFITGHKAPNRLPCVKIDARVDSFGEKKRKVALHLMRHALKRHGAKCHGQFLVKLSNIQMKDRILANVVEGDNYHSIMTKFDELPEAYDHLARALLYNEEVGSETTTRKNIVDSQSTRNRVSGEGLFTFELGGLQVLNQLKTVTDSYFGLGFRYELDSFGLEAILAGSPDQNNNDLSYSSFGLKVTYFLNPLSTYSVYFGGGLAIARWHLPGGQQAEEKTQTYGYYNTYESTYTEYNDISYRGNGVDSSIHLGIEFLRHSTVRFYFETRATLPTYKLEKYISYNSTGSDIYSAAVSIGLGAGYMCPNCW